MKHPPAFGECVIGELRDRAAVGGWEYRHGAELQALGLQKPIHEAQESIGRTVVDVGELALDWLPSDSAVDESTLSECRFMMLAHLHKDRSPKRLGYGVDSGLSANQREL